MRSGFLKEGVLGLVLAAVIVMQVAFAAGDERFDEQLLRIQGTIIDAIPAELDGSPGRELLVLTTDDSGGRHLQVFEKGFGRGYADLPIAQMVVAPQIFGMQVLDFDHDNREELLLLGLESVQIVEYENGAYSDAPRPLVTYEPLYSLPDPGTIRHLDFVFDVDEDSVYELLLPCWRGVKLFTRQNDNYVQAHEFVVRQRSRVLPNPDFLSEHAIGSFCFRLPKVAVHDLNTDRAKDVFVETDVGLAVFYQMGDMRFAPQPDKELDVRNSFLESLYFNSSDFGDLNGDGLVDYCRVFTQGDGYDAKSLLEIFLGNIHDGYPTRPSKRIVLEEFVVGLEMMDLDNDGSASLVVATQQLSTVGMVKSLMVKRIPVELKIFGSVGGLISEEPLAVKKTSCAVEILRSSFPARFIGCMSGDIDSDQRNELAIIDHDDELQVYQGDSESVFGDKPIYSMAAARMVSVEAFDLDQDRKSDLLLSGSDEDAHPLLMILWAR